MTQQLRVPAIYARGGTSKGLFFNHADLPEACQKAGIVRDAFLQRCIGSPDAYGKHIDGMGGATSSTSKAVILSASTDEKYDVNYLFGQIAIDKPLVDWSGNCGNLSAAVGPMAIHFGLVDQSRLPDNGICEVRIWQQNINKTIIAKVPIKDRQVMEVGDFNLDGVAFPAAEIVVDFKHPIDPNETLFPTGNRIDTLNVPKIGPLQVTMINAGIPSIFISAQALKFEGTETQAQINGDKQILDMLESIRAHGALAMGLIDTLDQAKIRQHAPKLIWVEPPNRYTASNGKTISREQIDINTRAMSMGQLHHAMMGTAAVAIASAAAIPDTIVSQIAGAARHQITFGHPSGILTVGATTENSAEGDLTIDTVSMSRSARILMEGAVRIPAESIELGGAS